MLGMLNQSQLMQKLAPIKNMANMLRTAGNPQMMFNQMMMQNPQMKQMMDYVNSNGGNAQALFYKMAEENGINPESVLQYLR